MQAWKFFFARFVGRLFFFPKGLIEENLFGKFIFFQWAKCGPKYFFTPDAGIRLFFLTKIRASNFFPKINPPPPQIKWSVPNYFIIVSTMVLEDRWAWSFDG